jgi:predicted transcriptional regulator
MMVSNRKEGNGNNKSPNEKATQAYKLYDEGKTPVEVAIQLGLSEKEATKYYKEYWRLNGLYGLYQVHIEIADSLPSFLKLHKALKKRGLNPNNVEWFANAVETEAIRIPEIQKQYAKIQDEIEAIDYKKTMAKHQLDNMNNQITYLNKISYNKRNEIAYLQIEAQELEGYVHGLENHNQQQKEIQNE